MKKGLSFILCCALIVSVLSGCNKNKDNDINDDVQSTPEISDGINSSLDTSANPDMFTDRDMDDSYDEGTAVKISLDDNTITATSDSVKITGSTVSITEEATYIITGTLDDGMIVVNAPNTAKLKLVLDNVDITSETSAPLYIIQADKVVVTLVGENRLTNGGSFEPVDNNNIDATVYSKEDLTFNGTGSLEVNSPVGHGITGKDDLAVVGGTYTISSSAHGIDANDSVRVKNAEFAIDAGKDGIHSENNDDTSKGFVYIESGEFNIKAEGDGISAGYYMQICDGNFNILAGGGYENAEISSSSGWGNFGGFGGGGMRGEKNYDKRNHQSYSKTNMNSDVTTVMSLNTATTDDTSTSMKGLKSVGNMVIDNGNFIINSADDSVHSDASLKINGGIFQIASGDDGVHAEDTLTINGGNIDVSNSYEGLEALHIVINSGDINTVSDDDGLNAAGGMDSSGISGGRDGKFGGMSSNSNGSILISGGTLYIKAGGDGIDANGTLEITGGHTVITGPTKGDTAVLDYDKTGVISGGTFIGTGSSMMAQLLTGSGQGVIGVSVGQQTAGTEITVSDNTGKEIISCSPELSYQIFIYSSPEIVSGETYTVSVGGSSAQFQAK